MPTQAQLQAFHQAAVSLINSIEDRVYRPNYFISLMAESGAFQAACQVIHSTHIPDGFLTLQQAGQLGLTIEALVLQPEWAEIFEPETLRLARERLTAFGYGE
jgi:hypothetical protein